MSPALSVRPVSRPADLEAFLRIPYGIYRGDPHWVAPLLVERRQHLSARHNPYFLHADARYLLAERGGEPVGRISAQVDRLRLERHRDATGQFGFLEAPDDPAVFAALTGAAEDWLRSRGLRRIQGPFSFSINDETGLLVDGFDRPPSMMMGHARPYYATRLEALGYAKAKDVIAYDYDGLTPLPRSMQAMVDKARASGDMTIRCLSKRHLKRDLGLIIDIFNDAWADNWGFVPMTSEEITALGNNLRMLVSEGYIAIASYRGEAAAMAVSLPDLNGWIADLGGRLLPLGWAKLAWRVFAKPPGAVRIPLMGVRKRHHGTVAGAALALGVIDAIRGYHVSRGTSRAELSWILEDNVPMRRMIEALGGVPYKTYRIYQKDLA